jgi:uncharacterized membrane protein YeaQ/YmgE (transglycosylase-associated protein family)
MTGWIATLVIGTIAGWLAEQIMKHNMSIWMNMAIGIVGAVIGKIIFGLLPIFPATGGFIWSIIVATVGAVVLLWIVGIVKKKTPA